MADQTDLTSSDSGAPLFGGVSRRKVVRAGVWTAPAIVVASAAPSFAASGDATWDITDIDGFRAAQNGTTKTTTTDGRMYYVKLRPILTNAFVASIPLTVTVTFPSGGGGVGWESGRSTLPSGWTLSSVTAAGGGDITATADSATNGLIWTFSGNATATTTQFVAAFGKNATNAGASGAVTGTDIAAPLPSVSVVTSSTDIAANRRQATLATSGTGTNAIIAGPATFS